MGSSGTDRFDDKYGDKDRAKFDRYYDENRYNENDKYNDRNTYNDRDRYNYRDRYNDRDRYDYKNRYNDGDRFDDSDRYKDINKYEDEDLLVQIYSLKLDYKYVSDRVSRSDETNNQPMSRVRLDISDAHFRVDGETEERLTKQSITADTGNYLTDKMARSVFNAVKDDLELQLENILTGIVLHLKNEAKVLNVGTYNRYKRDLTQRDDKTNYTDRMITGRSFHDKDETSFFRSSRRRKPMRKSSVNTDRKDQRISGRKSRRLQSKYQKHAAYNNRRRKQCSCKRGRDAEE